MQNKRPWFKSGYVWGIIFFVLGLITSAISGLPGTGPIGILILIITPIKRAISKGKNKRSSESAVSPVSSKTPSNQHLASNVPTPASSSVPSKPFVPPERRHGAYLAYSYDDVRIDSGNASDSVLQAIPVYTALTFKRYDDTGRLELYYDGNLVGEMYDNKLRAMALDFLRDLNRSALAVFKSASPTAINLYCYESGSKRLQKLLNREDVKEYRLVSNTNATMQEDISSCDEYEEVEFSFDYDKDKYLVISGGCEIGYMPVAFNKYIEAHPDLDGMISEINEPEDDDKKYTVSVVVAPKL